MAPDTDRSPEVCWEKDWECQAVSCPCGGAISFREDQSWTVPGPGPGVPDTGTPSTFHSRLNSLVRVSTLSRHGCILAIPALRKLRQEDSRYEGSPGYMMKPYLKTKMFFLVPAGVGTVPSSGGVDIYHTDLWLPDPEF